MRRRLSRKPGISDRLLCRSTSTSTCAITAAFQVSCPEKQNQEPPDKRNDFNWKQQLLQRVPTYPRPIEASQIFRRPYGAPALLVSFGSRLTIEGNAKPL